MKNRETDSIITDEGIVNQPHKIFSYSKEYYEFVFSHGVGRITTTPDHLWYIYNKTTNEVEIETSEYIYNNLNKYNLRLPYQENNIKIHTINKCYNENEKSFYCFKLNTALKMFKVIPKQTMINKIVCFFHYKHFSIPIFVHNCQMRIACGRLQSMASMMLFGNTIGTSIDGSTPGAGMISSNGVVYNIQYYFEEVEWLKNWYKKCGFNSKGFQETEETKEIPEEQTIEDSNIDDIFNFERDISTFEFEDIVKVVDKTEKQNFE